jgi:hemerythrin superfamily protein
MKAKEIQMSARHETLIPLTHDHHHALAQARRLLDAEGMADQTDRRNLTNDFVNFYFGRAVRHFHEEEELFFAPLVDNPEARDLVLRAVADHLRLHALVRGVKRQSVIGDADQRRLSEISRLLTEHVRFEEKELYPMIERLLPEAELQELAMTGRRDV